MFHLRKSISCFIETEVFPEIDCNVLMNAVWLNFARILPYRPTMILSCPVRFKLFLEDFEACGKVV
ncbi:MAG: hypothetical protein CEE38_15930 [Planctomycetes bacterium B3_Pla]|nr:MAG: hypothetical protein CEE38_15930 [Planctomycetes bacterium B3_Pla]